MVMNIMIKIVSLSLIEILCSLSKVCRAHHIISVYMLSTFGHHSFLISLDLSIHSNHLWNHSHILIHVILCLFPIYLKFSYSWLFNQNMSSKFLNIWLIWREFNQFGIFICICIVHIVSNSKKFLIIIV